MQLKTPQPRKSRSRERVHLYEDALNKQQLAQTPQTIAGGGFKDFDTLKLLPRNISSGKPRSTVTGRETMKTAKSTGYAHPVKTCHLDSVGLTTSDITSLKEGELFGELASSTRSNKRLTTTPSKKLDSKHRYLKKIIQHNNRVQKSLNMSHQQIDTHEGLIYD